MGGGEKGESCVFPFNYNGVEYNGCTTIDADLPWCFIDETGNWGYCGSNCKMHTTTGRNVYYNNNISTGYPKKKGISDCYRSGEHFDGIVAIFKWL